MLCAIYIRRTLNVHWILHKLFKLNFLTLICITELCELLQSCVEKSWILQLHFRFKSAHKPLELRFCGKFPNFEKDSSKLRCSVASKQTRFQVLQFYVIIKIFAYFFKMTTVWLKSVVSEKKEVAAFLRGDLLGWIMGYQGVPRSIRW